MKRLFKLLFIMVLPSLLLAAEQKKGSVSVLLFSEGKPLVSNEIKFDGKQTFKTDKDGSIQVPMVVGKHQVEIYGKDATGINLGYFKKQITIKEGKDTQVIATLSRSGADSIDIDTPVAAEAVKIKEVKKDTGIGRLNGRVLSSQGGNPIAGARVFVRGTSVDARTDEQGRFSVKVPSGTNLSISVVHSAYSAQTIGNIRVKKDGTTSRTIKLTPASMELEEYVVLAPKVEGSIEDVIAEEKNTNSIANIIGAEAFSKKGDSSAAAALKRASGITLVGGNVYVRGLGDRYGNIEMNSMPLPSPNPLKRLVPLDIFPSSVIGAMKIQKSGEADIPAAFGGGYINIRTKQSVTDDFIKITLGMGGNSNTGDSVISQNGGSKDWTGYDDGYWKKPSSTLSDSEFTQAYFKRDFTTPYDSLPVNFGGKIEAAKSYMIDEDHKISLFGTYRYQQKHEANVLEQFSNDMVRDTLGIDFTTSPPTAIFGPYYVKQLSTTTTESSSSTYSHGGVFDIGYNYLDVFRINYTKLYTHEGVDSVSLRTIDDTSGSDPTNYTYTLRWIEKTLDVDQLNGEFDYQIFDLASKLNFGLQRATSTFENPNTMEYIFEDCPEHLRGTPQCTTGRRLPTSVPNLNVRDERSEDVIDTYYLTNRFDTPIFSEEDYFEVGISKGDKTRDFASSPGRFIERSEISDVERDSNGDYIGDIQTLIDEHGDTLSYEESPLNNSANIKASVDQKNAYTKFFMNPYEQLEMIAGVRYVDITQTTSTIDSLNPSNNTTDSIELDKYFPSFSLRYKHDKDNHIDFAASKTYVMPDLIEFADAIIVAPTEKRIDIKGNPDLVPTMISNLDLKYSYYFGDSDFVKLGGFYKEMENPIEDAEIKSASEDVSVYTFINSDEATIYGIEIDGRTGLGFLTDQLSSFFLSGNYTYLDSEVTLTEEQALRFTTNNRQLQGLSQHILNLALEYETEDRSVVVAYNKMDERIRKIGYKDVPTTDVTKGIPDTYEIPPQVLDVVWKEKLSNGIDLKVKFGNLLDEETIWYRYGGSLLKGEGTSQDFARDNFITDRYKTGRTFSFEASYKY